MISVPITQIKNIVDATSNARRGNVDKLPLGAANYYHTDKPVIASTGSGGTTLYKPAVVYTKYGVSPSANFRVDTFIVCVKKKIKYDADVDLEFDRMAKQFATFETTEILKRIRSVEDIIYAPGEEVERLQKFFDDLNRPVAVLKTGQVVDMGDNFTLVVRTDICAEVFDEPSTQSHVIAMWEDVGFFCEVT